MTRKILAALFAALLVATFAGCSSGDDSETSTEDEDASASATTEEEAEDEDASASAPAEDEDEDSDKADPKARALIEDLESSGALGSGDIDPEVEECLTEAVLEEPELMDLVESDAEPDPASPEFATLMEVIVGCDGRPFLQDAFMEGFGESTTPEQAECVEEYFDGLSDDEFVQLISDLAAEDTSAMSEIIACMS